MADEQDRFALTEKQVTALAVETGVSPDQIREIARWVGSNRSSIVLQARALAKQRKL